MLPYPGMCIRRRVCMRQESWHIAFNLKRNEPSLLRRGQAYLYQRERGQKRAQSKVFVKKRADPKLEADYEVPKTLFGIRDLRPGLGISKQNWSHFFW